MLIKDIIAREGQQHDNLRDNYGMAYLHMVLYMGQIGRCFHAP